MRKLGFKNIRLFIFLFIIIILFVIMFIVCINYVSQNYQTTYEISTNSLVLNENNEYVTTLEDSILKQKFDGNYYLTYDDSQSKIGKTAIVYNSNDYKMYIYGQAYLINEDGSVTKSSDVTEIIKASSPFFYKLSDRKYLFVDKNIFTSDGTINTTDFLFVTLDTQGNATLTNQKISLKTINPIILKGSIYDFDVANEKLIIGDNEIDLKNIIGSSNLYTKETETKEETSEEEISGDEEDDSTSYYDEYLKSIVESFNNLQSSLEKSNTSIAENSTSTSSDDTYLDLTRWLSITDIETTPNSIVIDYTVFDPNNEYMQVYLTVAKSGSEEYQTYVLSKEQTTYTIRGLDYDSEYTINLNYILVTSLDSTGGEVTKDTLKVKTAYPNMEIVVTKISANKIYYIFTLDETYLIDQATIVFYSDGVALDKIIFNSTSNYVYSSYFEYTSLGYQIEIAAEDIYFNGNLTTLKYSSKFING